MSVITLSAPLTHSDWMLKPGGPAWGPEGVRRMLTRCVEFGFDKVFWRCYDCGRSTYPSRLIEPFVHHEHEVLYQFSPGYLPAPTGEALERWRGLDYRAFDSLEAAVRIGHELGLQVHAWMTLNEDDHGFGWPSRFAREHPEFRWVRRDGTPYHSQLSYAYPQVRAYKLDLVREVLAYDVDGVLLDWIRTGDIRDNPQTNAAGYADHGYEQPNLDAFRQRFGEDARAVDPGDPRWVALCAEPITAFMRAFRPLCAAHARPLRTAALVQHPWAYRGILPEQITSDAPQWVINMRGNRYAGASEGLLCDIRTWAREGLVDTVLASGYYCAGGTPTLAYRYIERETEGRLPLTLYGWVPEQVGDIERDVRLAEELGATELLLWEADYVDSRPADKLAAIRAWIRSYRQAARNP
ncbi:MAG: family 10 glycosylhydrolase [Chloroflexi bacterium]|nr:family 10 glycosylhydrolase [Chloroflexota bacterium]